MSSENMLVSSQASALSKCGYCCEWLKLSCYDENPHTKKPYSKCKTCRPKHAAKSHAKRNADVAERIDSKKAKLESGELKNCQGCGPKPIAAFGINASTGEPYSRCETCRPKHAASGNTKRNADVAAQKAAIDAGETPDTLICAGCGVQPFAAFGTNNSTGKPHVNCKPCHVKMMKGLAEHKMTEAGKEAEKRYKSGEAGQAAAARFVEKLTERRRASPAMRMDDTIMSASYCLISGRYMTSPTFIQRTSFDSEAEFLGAVTATFPDDGSMTFDNYGDAWELDHRIPREAYDFGNPEDIRRCWSAKNVQALTPTANMQKSFKLLDDQLLFVGRENFPVAWNNEFPTEPLKEEFYRRVKAEKEVQKDIEFDYSEEAPSSSSGVVAPEAPDSESDVD